MTSQKVTVRPARSGDEPHIAKVHIQAWQEAYKEIIPQTYLDHLPAELNTRTENWKKTLVNTQRWTWVAEGPTGIVGFIIFGLPRDKNRDGFIELGAIYLLASEKGKGIGFSLLSAGFSRMTSLGYNRAYCWVLEENPTNKFYERSGAIFNGQTKNDEIGGKEFKELMYEWNNFATGSGQ